nr:PREDICTED: uncharacterized protein LOC107077804 isoform X1 [Lepisosteus oculatus]
MSIQESPEITKTAEQSQGTVGLKRKLTGPPRLLLGKTKPKRQYENRAEARAKRLRGERTSNGNQMCLEIQPASKEMDNMTRQEGIPQVLSEIVDLQKESALSTDEGQKATASAGVDSVESWCKLKETKVNREEHLQAKNKDKRKLMKSGWKQSHKPSLFCLRNKKNKSDKTSNKDGEQNTDVPLYDRETRDLTDTSIKPASEDIISGEEYNTESFNHQFDSGLKKKGKLPGRIWSSFKKLVIQSNVSKKSRKGILSQETDCGTDDALNATSFKKKIVSFFNHGTKKHSASFHEDLRTTQESEEEAKRILTNKNADICFDILTDVQRGASSDETFEGSAPSSEILTVNVDVSIAKIKGKDERGFDECQTYKDRSVDMFTECHKLDSCLAEGKRQSQGCIRKTPEKIETVEIIPTGKSMLSFLNETQKDPDDFSTSSPFSVCVDDHKTLFPEQNLSATSTSGNKPVKVSRDAINREMKMVKEIQNTENDYLLCHSNNGTNNSDFEKNGSEVIPKININICSVDDINSEYNDVLLLQTAYSVVKTAMQAALAEFTEELNTGSCSILK